MRYLILVRFGLVRYVLFYSVLLENIDLTNSIFRVGGVFQCLLRGASHLLRYAVHGRGEDSAVAIVVA